MAATLGCGEDTDSPTAPETAPALRAKLAQVLSFRQVSAGSFFHTCGVTVDNLAYCWGGNFSGQLGDGTTTEHFTPVAVTGGLRFHQVSVGSNHTCGLTLNNRAFCWGPGGLLGDDTPLGTNRLTPSAVAGGLRFRQVSAGEAQTCGVTRSKRAFCWGGNGFGQLGDGTTTTFRPTPVRVAGGLRFVQVSAGTFHTCGVTMDHLAYCWGGNFSGELGDGTTTQRLAPVPVVGALRFLQVEAGTSHTCGVTTDELTYCWGFNGNGELGNITPSERSLTPVAVAGEHRFRDVSAGEQHTCGVDLLDQAFCWGSNNEGTIGDGTIFENRLTPVAVAGGLSFRQVSAGNLVTCGVTTEGAAYCWGRNDNGQLGDGTTTGRITPVPVAGPA